MNDGTRTTELDQRLGMDKPRKAKLEIRSIQDSPRQTPRKEDNLKKGKST